MKQRYFYLCLMSVALIQGTISSLWAQVPGNFLKGKLIYANSLSDSGQLQDWVMEGPGRLSFSDGWMDMYSPNKKWDHVLWCPADFPESFIAEWDLQNREIQEGLVIIFFAAKGAGNRDIFDKSMPARDGTFKYYNRGEMNCYHISYYANNPKLPDRGNSHLRKDPSFALLQTGAEGIPAKSTGIHHVCLIKKQGRIVMYVDNNKIIDYNDEGKENGPVYGAGKIGFRQMRWSHFRYRDFKVWNLK